MSQRTSERRCPLEDKPAYVPTLCPVCENKLGACPLTLRRTSNPVRDAAAKLLSYIDAVSHRAVIGDTSILWYARRLREAMSSSDETPAMPYPSPCPYCGVEYQGGGAIMHKPDCSVVTGSVATAAPCAHEWTKHGYKYCTKCGALPPR